MQGVDEESDDADYGDENGPAAAEGGIFGLGGDGGIGGLASDEGDGEAEDYDAEEDLCGVLISVM